MSDAKRYDVTEKYIGTGEYVGAMEESATGDWVAFSDYAPLKARLEEAERLLLKFHTAGPAGITALIDEVPAFLGITDSASVCPVCNATSGKHYEKCPRHYD